MRRIALLSLALAQVGCAGPQVAAPLSPQGAAFAVSIRTRAILGPSTSRPDLVYFVRLGQGDDPYLSGQVVPSNLSMGDYVYLLNAPPGRYAAVAAFDRQGGPGSMSAESRTMFRDSLRLATEVDIEPGSFAFMGDFVVQMSNGVDDDDPIQAHFLALIAPGQQGRGFLARALSGQNLYAGAAREMHRDAEAEIRFLTAARSDLADSGWLAAIERRTAQLAIR